MDTCDHSKQGLKSEIAPETQHNPDSKVTDGSDPSKSALDKHEVSHENFDMDANDQSKQGPEPEIGTENQNRPEPEVTDGGNTSINVPGVNIGTDVISPREGGSDGKIDGSTVLPSNPLLTGKLLMYQKIFGIKTKTRGREKEKKTEKETKEKKQKTTKEKSRKTSSYCKEQNWKIST
jgi:hypothetical protein